MGKPHKPKNNNKSSNAANSNVAQTQAATKRPKQLSPQTRNELNKLVGELLELGLKPTNNPTEEYRQYYDMQTILSVVQELEAPLRRASTNATPEARLSKIDAFYRWAKANGVQYDGLRIAEFPGYDLGLEATRDITSGEQLFSIPRKLMMSEENLEKDCNPAHFGAMSNLKLAYVLMNEVLKPDSFWKPYIDLLPDKYSTVLYYSIRDMDKLRGSNALSAALRQCKAITTQYAVLYNCAHLSPRTGITSVGKRIKENFCYDLYRWVVSTVMTRENMIPRSRPAPTITNTKGELIKQPESIAALIPFWDMANYRHGTITSYYNIEWNEMESAAQADFRKGEQIFIHYGDRSNADLMLHNGFLNPTNPKDSINIKLGLGTSDALYEQRAHLLQLLQIPKNSELKVLPAPEYISPELLAFVRVFNMNAAQLEHWINSERAMDLLHIDCALETALESKTWQYLQTRLMLLLRVFPSTLAEDETQLAAYKNGKKSLTYIEAMLLEYRVLEKRILEAALDYAKQRTKA